MEIRPEGTRQVHLQVGKENRIAVVFSCPGRHEELAGCPAAKATGRNLELLLSLLAEALGRSDLTREMITITNAWPEVEYLAKTRRTEATTREITAPDNVRRLELELQDVTDLVIFCGERAKIIARHLRLARNPKLVYIGHPGLRGLSTINTDAHGERIVAAPTKRGDLQALNTRKRLEVLVHRIVCQLQEQGDDPRPPGEGGRRPGEGERRRYQIRSKGRPP